MRTTALDTNAILNYRLDRKPHSDKVKAIFERALEGKEQIFIPVAVFLECEWVLRSFYKQSKDQIIKFFQELLSVDNILLQDKQDLELALNLYKSYAVSFTDCLIIIQIQNFKPDEFLTFDEDLIKLYQDSL